jgi:hypothetical protein
MQDFLINEIKDYIENEKIYIKQELDDDFIDIDSYREDLEYLKNLDNEDINNMANDIIKNGFVEYLDELIHNELYK